MVSSDMFYQFIDWRHDQIDPNEPFDHKGTLATSLIIPKITIGLSDWWNISFQQVLGDRHMGWDLPDSSTHHRPEHSHSNFLNAVGGYLGDSRLMLRYLALNTGRGAGSRLFIGFGYGIPSKNTLTKSPFDKDEEENYLISLNKNSSARGVRILNYINKTDSNIKEVHYWLYLYQYASKKAYVDLIIKNNKSIRNRLSQIYEKCIKGILNGLIFDFNLRKKSYKNKQLLHKMK